jgi:hypothetical protein
VDHQSTTANCRLRPAIHGKRSVVCGPRSVFAVCGYGRLWRLPRPMSVVPLNAVCRLWSAVRSAVCRLRSAVCICRLWLWAPLAAPPSDVRGSIKCCLPSVVCCPISGLPSAVCRRIISIADYPIISSGRTH